jgi:hypothetical protein
MNTSIKNKNEIYAKLLQIEKEITDFNPVMHLIAAFVKN